MMSADPGFFLHSVMLLPPAALAALLLDYLLAEPQRFHPLVIFGHWAQWLEKRLNCRASRHNIARGLLALLAALSPLLLILLLNLFLWQQAFWLWLLLQIVMLWSCIGWQSLQQHVLAVYQALQANDLPAAREKLSWIVSRDTGQLNDDEVSQAAIESALENSADALFVSLFWFALGVAFLGALPALLHRWVNTLDAMWGYRNERYRHFGRAAARLDDLLAFWPARLTALCFTLCAGRNFTAAWHCWRRQAGQCASPNGGPVMTSGAGALQVRLSERACYHGEWKNKAQMGCGRPAQAADIPRALTLVRCALWLFFLFWCAALLIIFPVLV